ncbi:MAG: hypothetical protein H0T93_12115 [Chloroflexia bacterium]|nr:hypothetical protein [Chloroflexia bacterium]
MLTLRPLLLLPRLLARVGASLLLTGRIDRRRLLLPSALPSLLHLLPSQLVVLAGGPLRLAPTLISLGLVGTVAALASLTLVAPWLLARTLVRALLILAIPVVPRRRLRTFSVLVLRSLRISSPVLGPLIGGWASPAAAALSRSL